MTKSKANLQHSITESSTTGERLRYARELRGLTQSEVAKALCLNTNIIDALEKDNFHELSAPVFIKGYIRNYSNLLRVSLFDDDRPLANLPENKLDPKVIIGNPPLFQTVLYFSGRLLFRLLNYLVITGLAVLVFIWWHDRHHAIENANSVINMSIQKVPFSRLTDIEQKEATQNKALFPAPFFDSQPVDVTNLNQVLPWWQFSSQGN